MKTVARVRRFHQKKSFNIASNHLPVVQSTTNVKIWILFFRDMENLLLLMVT